MEIIVSLASLLFGALGTYYAWLQVKAARQSGGIPSPALEARQALSSESLPVPQADGLSIASLADLRRRGLSTGQIIQRLIEMDYDNIPGITEDNVGRCETWLPIVENNPDGMKMVVDDKGSIVGYWHFFPLDDEAYKEIKQGTLDDGNIRLSHLNIIGPPGDYNLYFTIICINPEHRGLRVTRMLLDAFTRTLSELASRDIFFPEMCAVAFSEEGKAMCKTLKMQFQGYHANRDPIFTLDLRTLPQSLMYDRKLRELYENRYHPR